MTTLPYFSLNFSIQTWYSRAGKVAPAPLSETLPDGGCGVVAPDEAGGCEAPVPLEGGRAGRGCAAPRVRRRGAPVARGPRHAAKTKVAPSARLASRDLRLITRCVL